MHSRFKALENYSEKDLGKLKNSTVAVIGLGATGSVIAEHLARHGVNLILIDRDYLEENDLYSSSIYTEEDVENAEPKAKTAATRLSQFTDVDFHVEDLTSENIEVLDEADLIMDGTDNLETRLLISEYCSRENKPWIYTAAIAEKGFSMLFDEECFSCLFESIRASDLETCETAGIMREISSMAASRSSMKAVKYLAGNEVSEDLDTIHTGKSYSFESEGCSVCEEDKYERLESAPDIGKICGENKYQIQVDITEKAVESMKNAVEVQKENSYLLQAERNGSKLTVFRSGRVIVEADSKSEARQSISEILGV